MPLEISLNTSNKNSSRVSCVGLGALATLLVILTFCNAARGAVDPRLVSWWRAEDNTKDSIGTNHGVSYSGGYGTGKIGNAFTFAGSQRLELGNPESLSLTTNFTIGFWVYVNESTPSGGAGVVVFRGDERSGLDPIGIAINTPSILTFQTTDAQGQSSSVSATVELQRWTHVTCVFFNGAQQLYFDGLLVQSINNGRVPFAELSSRGGFTIGNTTSEHNFPFQGKLDEIAIFSRALNAAEVGQLYVGGVESVCAAGDCPPIPQRTAKAKAQVVNGFVVGCQIVDSGYGYTNAPLVKIVGGGGNGAIGRAILENGIVVAIEIENAGKGYTGIPTVKIAAPPNLPKLSMTVASVRLELTVTLGHRYQVFVSNDTLEWAPIGEPFEAEDNNMGLEFPVNNGGRYFKIVEVP